MASFGYGERDYEINMFLQTHEKYLLVCPYPITTYSGVLQLTSQMTTISSRPFTASVDAW